MGLVVNATDSAGNYSRSQIRSNGPAESSPGLRSKANALGKQAKSPCGLKGRENGLDIAERQVELALAAFQAALVCHAFPQGVGLRPQPGLRCRPVGPGLVSDSRSAPAREPSRGRRPRPLSGPTISPPPHSSTTVDERRGEAGADGTRTGPANCRSGQAGAVPAAQLHSPARADPRDAEDICRTSSTRWWKRTAC
jgi:hypothetical protein